MKDLSTIKSIDFGIFSPEEIEKLSVCAINISKLSGPNSIYDERMGVMDNSKICVQCERGYKECPGHFGHIKMNHQIIHPLYYRYTLSFLKCFCYKCSRVIINQEQFIINDLFDSDNEQMFKNIVDKCEKNEMCIHCMSQQPKFSLSTDNILFISDGKSAKIQIDDSEVKRVFDGIITDDIKFMGFNPDNFHPRNLIIQNLLVIPPIARPFIITNEVTCDDDLTIQYIEIIKCNNQLDKNNSLTENKKQKFIQTIKFRIKCLFDNSQEKIKHTNGRPLKGIKKRLAGKEGQIRNNLMGKRVNKSGRTVIGPDPTLKLTEIAVPKKMTENLSYPMMINRFNINDIYKILLTKKANFLIKNEDDGKTTRVNLKYALYNKMDLVSTIDEKMDVLKNFELNLGDVIERKLRDGDIVLLNRQPTLHKGSMLAKTIKIIGEDVKTIRMNLATTKTFNADFDGDEMNIHSPSNLEAEAELRFLSATNHNLISAQGSKPNIAIVQDALLGSYLMTKDDEQLEKGSFCDILMNVIFEFGDCVIEKMNYVHTKYEKFDKPELCYTGKALFSCILPKDFCYEKGKTVIKDGILLEGVINKKQLGSSQASFIMLLFKEYNEGVSVEFINNAQFIANAWLLQNGFSMSIKDCRVTKSSEIDNVTQKCFFEANRVKESTTHPLIREARINGALSKARDNGMRIAKEALNEDNNFISTVTAGSKGDYFNIAQITGLMGQQNLTGKRITKTLNNGKRSLPHYRFDLPEEDEYESRGFIKNSLAHGLNPREFFFHSMTGREGVTDTSMKTASTGYIQRKMIKVAEDCTVQYDGSVRNANGNLLQMQYGEDGLDGSNTVIVDNKAHILDVSRICGKLNSQYENREEDVSGLMEGLSVGGSSSRDVDGLMEGLKI